MKWLSAGGTVTVHRPRKAQWYRLGSRPEPARPPRVSPTQVSAHTRQGAPAMVLAPRFWKRAAATRSVPAGAADVGAEREVVAERAHQHPVGRHRRSADTVCGRLAAASKPVTEAGPSVSASASVYSKRPAAPPPTTATLLPGWVSSTLPPLERASSVPAVMPAPAACVMLPALSRPSCGVDTGAARRMLPPPPFCSVSAEASAKRPHHVDVARVRVAAGHDVGVVMSAELGGRDREAGVDGAAERRSAGRCGPARCPRGRRRRAAGRAHAAHAPCRR